METIVQVPYGATVKLMLGSLERNLLPDVIIRRLTRLLLASRLRSGYKSSSEKQLSDLLQFVNCCGWGSLSMYIAQKYSNCKVTGICNSVTQKAHIEEQCRDLKLQNVEIIVADISTFDMEGSFDRIFSIEMFEKSSLKVNMTIWFCSEEWLKRMDCNLKAIRPIMESTYGKDSAVKWTVYWRTFFIAVAELFAYNDGEEWMVAHLLFKKN
ncbi:hypothetical protein Leryth_013284 [Lithospermum erythrorhizon]|nr:hypothetical protein Leryth_013284 [Lithospermum erythrorhizon]